MPAFYVIPNVGAGRERLGGGNRLWVALTARFTPPMITRNQCALRRRGCDNTTRRESVRCGTGSHLR